MTSYDAGHEWTPSHQKLPLHGTHRRLRLDLGEGVDEGAHVLRSWNGERGDQRVVHRVVQDRVERLRALPRERLSGAARSCVLVSAEKITMKCSPRVVVEDLADAEHARGAAEGGPERHVHVPGRRRECAVVIIFRKIQSLTWPLRGREAASAVE